MIKTSIGGARHWRTRRIQSVAAAAALAARVRAGLTRSLTVAAALTVHLLAQAQALPPSDAKLLRLQCVVLVALLASPLVRLATYHPWADGPWVAYTRLVAYGIVGAAAAWLVVRVQTRSRSLLPWLAALGVLAPGDAVHYLRLAHATTWTPEAVVADSFSSPGADAPPAAERWQAVVQPGASATVKDGALQIQGPAHVAGFVDLRLPPRPAPQEGKFWLPLGLYTDTYEESLEWEAQVGRDNAFFIMAQVGDLLLQVASDGLHINYPGLDGQLASFEVPTPLVNDGQPHHYLLERTDGLIRLRLDGSGIWVRPEAGQWAFVRFGETRSDAQHGGTLLLDNVRYTRRYGSG